MNHVKRTKSATALAVVTGVALLGSLVGAATTANADPGNYDRAASRNAVTEVRQAIDPYRDVKVAEAAGYLPVSDCVSSPEGGMGFHYLNPGLAAGPINPGQPPILLYGPDGDGSLQLLGAEWLVPIESESQERPDLAGEPFNAMDAHDGLPPHFELHVWTHVVNPSGVFSTWNPRVSC